MKTYLMPKYEIGDKLEYTSPLKKIIYITIVDMGPYHYQIEYEGLSGFTLSPIAFIDERCRYQF